MESLEWCKGKRLTLESLFLLLPLKDPEWQITWQPWLNKSKFWMSKTIKISNIFLFQLGHNHQGIRQGQFANDIHCSVPSSALDHDIDSNHCDWICLLHYYQCPLEDEEARSPTGSETDVWHYVYNPWNHEPECGERSSSNYTEDCFCSHLYCWTTFSLCLFRMFDIILGHWACDPTISRLLVIVWEQLRCNDNRWKFSFGLLQGNPKCFMVWTHN